MTKDEILLRCLIDDLHAWLSAQHAESGNMHSKYLDVIRLIQEQKPIIENGLYDVVTRLRKKEEALGKLLLTLARPKGRQSRRVRRRQGYNIRRKRYRT